MAHGLLRETVLPVPRGAILNGEFEPGMRISESEIAQLEQEGLVSVTHRDLRVVVPHDDVEVEPIAAGSESVTRMFRWKP